MVDHSVACNCWKNRLPKHHQLRQPFDPIVTDFADPGKISEFHPMYLERG